MLISAARCLLAWAPADCCVKLPLQLGMTPHPLLRCEQGKALKLGELVVAQEVRTVHSPAAVATRPGCGNWGLVLLSTEACPALLSPAPRSSCRRLGRSRRPGRLASSLTPRCPLSTQAENKQLQRQLSALQAAAHGGGSVPVTPTAGGGGSSGSTAPWQAGAPSRTVAQLSLAQLRLLQGELEQARTGLQAQAEQLVGVREDYEARKRCLKEAAGALGGVCVGGGWGGVEGCWVGGQVRKGGRAH